MHLCKCNDSAAFFYHFLAICTRFLYTPVECACGTLQTNRQIKYNCLTKRMATVQVIHISLLCCHVLHPNNSEAFSATFGPHWNVSYTLIKTAGVVHHRSAVRSRILLSVTEWQACMLSDFLCRLHAYVQMLLHCSIFSPFPANVHTFSVYSSGVCTWYITNQQTN